jgi:hypothetical protein
LVSTHVLLPQDFHASYQKLRVGLAKTEWEAAYRARNLDGPMSSLHLLSGSLLRLLPVIGTSLAQANIKGSRQLQVRGNGWCAVDTSVLACA